MRAIPLRALVLFTLGAMQPLAAEPAPPTADFVFTSNRDGNSEIYLLAGGETEWRNLTNHPGADNWPVWSPDGSRIAFQRMRDGKLYAVPAHGGDPMLIVGGPDREAEGSWRPGSLPDAVEQGGSDVTEGRVLHKQIRVAAPIETVWNAWTTEEGLKFVSAKSNVRLEIGGPYEWFLDLEPDERGRRGGEGAVIHAFLPPEMLAFSWTFPPSIPSLRNADARTRVVVRFREVDGGTEVDFHQAGWQQGEDWDRGHEYFDAAWDSVLARLKTQLEGATDEPG